MRKGISLTILIVLVISVSLAFAKEAAKVGGYEQYPPGPTTEGQIGAGWGHRSMTFGMMNMMSGITAQMADMIRSGKATPEMMKRVADILSHLAEMMNDAPDYMMGTKVVDSKMIEEMGDILKDLEKMRKETGLR
jgi:urease gamma subunit